MSFGMDLNKNRHGTYEARKKVPTHLEEAVARVLDNGKPKQIWLKRSLATKDHSEAKRAGEGTGGSSRGSRYFNTGLTVTLMDLRWDQVDFKAATLHVRRVKQGTPSVHPIAGDELRALRRLQREQELKSPFVFTSERGAPFTTAGFARMVERAGIAAELGFKVHPHMLRHACGYALANQGHDTRALQAYLGHKNIQHTVRYTELSPLRFKDFWRA